MQGRWGNGGRAERGIPARKSFPPRKKRRERVRELPLSDSSMSLGLSCMLSSLFCPVLRIGLTARLKWWNKEFKSRMKKKIKGKKAKNS